MSHFTVLVVTETPDQVEEALAPYHEYESTGVEDEYVVEVDITDEVNLFLERELFVGKRQSDGAFDYEYRVERANKCLQSFSKMTRREYILKAKLDIDQQIQNEFCARKVGDRWFDKTNPNAKWDWWTIGGRWCGFFKLKPGATGNKGRKPLIMGGGESDGIDQAIKRDIDFEAMMQVAEDEAQKIYNVATNALKGRTFESWDSVRNRIEEVNAARKFYNAQPEILALRNALQMRHWDLDDFLKSREEFIREARNGAISTFAVVKDGEWIEKAQMGWFASTSNENENWQKDYLAILDSIPEDACLTLVDCHI